MIRTIADYPGLVVGRPENVLRGRRIRLEESNCATRAAPLAAVWRRFVYINAPQVSNWEWHAFSLFFDAATERAQVRPRRRKKERRGLIGIVNRTIVSILRAATNVYSLTHLSSKKP